MAILGGYLVVFELGLRGLIGGDSQWLLSTNATALITGRYHVPVAHTVGLQTTYEDVLITAARGAIVIAIAVAIVTAINALLLQRRDAN